MKISSTMTIFRQDHKLKDIIFYDPQVLTVLNRLGIYLGVGEKTLREACAEKGTDSTLAVTIINTYLFADYFPEKIFKSFPIDRIVEYLRKTDKYYSDFQLPNISRHFNSLISHSGNAASGNLELLRKFFDDMAEQLQEVIDFDSTQLFPKVLDNEITPGSVLEHALKIESICNSVEDKLTDLLTFFVVHLKGDYEVNLCRAVVTAIFTLEKDIRQNNRIRQRILIPLLQEKLEEAHQE